ncbi:hypothetical protein ABBQ32_009822 [Trebouxia sp. C0010 RCD-2024]
MPEMVRYSCMRSSQARISESTAILENLLGLGRSTLTCLPANAAAKGNSVLTVEGVDVLAGNESDAALPIGAGWFVEVCNPAVVKGKGAEGNEEEGGSVLTY